MSVIEIRDLRASVIVGVLEHERVNHQPVTFDLDLVRDVSEAARQDDLNLTTNYAAVMTRVYEIAADGKFFLLETLAHRVAETILNEDTALTAVTVVVHKLKPPVVEDVTTVGVRVTVSRP